MKKILYALLLAGVALTSCNEDILSPEPTSKIDAKYALSSTETLKAFRNGLYGQGTYYAVNETPLLSGKIALLSDIMGNDMVYGYTWDQTMNSAFSYKVGVTSGEPLDIWKKMYFLQEACNTLINTEITNMAIDPVMVKTYKAEALALRAYVYIEVVKFFGKAYSLDNGTSKAFPYVATVNYTDLPERNTVAKIYELAIADLTSAIADLPLKKTAGAYYMNKNAAYATLARIYADMHNYNEARKYAKLALTDIGFMSTAEYKKGLSNGATNPETILSFYTDPNQYNKWRSFNSYHDSYDGMGDDFVCNTSLVGQFADNDIRRGFFLDERYYYKYYDGNVYKGNSYSVDDLIGTADNGSGRGLYTYGKFPRRDVVMGSSRGSLGVGDYIAIRATEMKLLVAECDARLGDNNTEAQDILFDIQNRAVPSVKTTETGANLLALIKAETRRELFGEGHSISLIKRWGDGLTRDGSQPTHLILAPGAPEFVWPTPERETTVNKNLLK